MAYMDDGFIGDESWQAHRVVDDPDGFEAWWEVYREEHCLKPESKAFAKVVWVAARNDSSGSSESLLSADSIRTGCQDCERPYGHEHGFPDFIIPFSAWKQISPTGDDGGLLCPSCICQRLHNAGIRCEGAFMSGPIISVSETTMNSLRRVENIELAIAGRDNRWAAVRELVGVDESEDSVTIVVEKKDAG